MTRDEWPQGVVRFDVDGLVTSARNVTPNTARSDETVGILIALNSYVNWLPADIQDDVSQRLVQEIFSPREFVATVRPRRGARR